jgi:hypothetical protein
MELKERFKNRIKSIKAELRDSGEPATVGHIAAKLGYSREHLQTLIGKSGVVTEAHLRLLNSYFPEKKENITERASVTTEKDLLSVLVTLMKTQNHILTEQKVEIIDRVKRMDTNLNTALSGVAQLSLHVESAREVILESLTRLEKKEPGTLAGEADKIVMKLMAEQSKQGNPT